MAPLTLVRGLPGKGKTSLVADWAESRSERGDIVHWFHGDADALGLADAFALEPTDQSRHVVIIDDAHLISQSPDLDALIARLWTDPTLHLVLCSRGSIPAVDRARAAGMETVVVMARDLNATADEILELTEAWGFDVTPERARDLLDMAGGWLAPTRIALDHADPEFDPDGRGAAARFLLEELLPALRILNLEQAALTLSVVPEVCGNLAERLFSGSLIDDADPAEPTRLILDRLERYDIVHYFTRSDGEEGWRLSPLAQRLFLAVFESREPLAAARAHQTVVEVMEAHADPAIGSIALHTRAANDWDHLATLWERHGLSLVADDLDATLAAFKDLPAEVLERSDVLESAVAVLGSFAPARANRPPEHRVAVARGTVGRVGAENGTLATTSAIIALRESGYVEGALRLSEEHAAVIGIPATLATATNQAWFELHHGLASCAAGKGVASLLLLERAEQDALEVGAEFIAAPARACRAMINALVGQGPIASALLNELQTDDRMLPWISRFPPPSMHVAQGVLLLDQLDPRASAELDQAASVVRTPDE